jgi:nucleoside permease NupC
MIFTGLAIFAGAALLAIKLRRRLLLRALNHDLAVDVAVTAVVMVLHWGTFSGVLGATIAGVFTSLATSAAKRMFGFIRDGVYHPGIFFLDPRG